MRFKSFLVEMPPEDVSDVEDDIQKMFRGIGIAVKFTDHFEDRITDGSYRGDQIEKEDLLDLFTKLKKKHDELIAAKRDRSELEGVIRDLLVHLNVPFALTFDRRSGKFILTLITAMKKNKPFHTKPEDVVIDV